MCVENKTFEILKHHLEVEKCIWVKSWEYLGEGTEMMEERISRCRAKSRICEAFLTLDEEGAGFVSLEDLKRVVNE